MSYPQRPRGENTNDQATINPAQAPTPASPQAPAVVGPSGGAPSLKPWAGTQSKTPSTPLPASPWSLKDIGDQYKPVVDRIKTNLQKSFESLSPEQRNTTFWVGFSQYPEQMAQMIVRRVLTNRMANQVNQGPIAEWMAWIDQGRR